MTQQYDGSQYSVGQKTSYTTAAAHGNYHNSRQPEQTAFTETIH